MLPQCRCLDEPYPIPQFSIEEIVMTTENSPTSTVENSPTLV